MKLLIICKVKPFLFCPVDLDIEPQDTTSNVLFCQTNAQKPVHLNLQRETGEHEDSAYSQG